MSYDSDCSGGSEPRKSPCERPESTEPVVFQATNSSGHVNGRHTRLLEARGWTGKLVRPSGRTDDGQRLVEPRTTLSVLAGGEQCEQPLSEAEEAKVVALVELEQENKVNLIVWWSGRSIMINISLG